MAERVIHIGMGSGSSLRSAPPLKAPASSSSQIELSERIQSWMRHDDGARGGGGICGGGTAWV